MPWPKKSYKEFDNEKKFLRLENPPPPLNFSNGPSLNYTCFIQARSSKRNTSLKAIKTHSLKINDLEKSSLSRKNVEEKVQLLMHQKILIFSSAYSCTSFLPQKPLPLFAEKAVIPHNRCQLAIEHGMREQSYVNRELKQQRRRRLQKRHLKGEFAPLQTLSRLFHLVYFVKCWQTFLELNSKGLYQSSGKEKKVVVLCSRPRQNVNSGIFTL